MQISSEGEGAVRTDADRLFLACEAATGSSSLSGQDETRRLVLSHPRRCMPEMMITITGLSDYTNRLSYYHYNRVIIRPTVK